MKILFVWLNAKGVTQNNLLPLGIGYLAANLPEKHTLSFWDGVLNKKEGVDLLKTIAHFKPQIVAFSVWNFNLEEAADICAQIKRKYPKITMVLGGPSVSGFGTKILEMVRADLAIAGEGEKPFTQLVDYLESKKKKDFSKKINGLIYWDREKIKANSVSWEPLTRIKYCDYGFINLKKYLDEGYNYSASFHPAKTRLASIVTTRGCPYPCQYCSARRVNGRVIRERPIASIINEILELYRKYKVRGFNIIDDNFTFKMDFAKKVCRAVLSLGLTGITFNSPNGIKIEYLDSELLSLMKKLGWRYLFVAPESGSQTTLDRMKKIIDLSKVGEKIALIKKYGISVFGYFIIGYPGETRQDIYKTIDFSVKHDFDAVVFTCFMPLPGTPIYEELIARKEITGSVFGKDFFGVSYVPMGMSKTELKFWRWWGFFRFYTSNFKRFQRAMSAYSLNRFFKAVGQMVR